MTLLYREHPDKRSLELELRNLARQVDELVKAGKRARTRDRGIAGAAAVAPLPITRGVFEFTAVAAGEPLVI